MRDLADARLAGELVWRKSSQSGVVECVEVAIVDDAVLVRDSKRPSGPVLRYTAAEWRAFVEGVHLGEFDLWLDLPD